MNIFGFGFDAADYELDVDPKRVSISDEKPDEGKDISSGMSRRTNPQDAYMAESPGRALHARISSSER